MSIAVTSPAAPAPTTSPSLPADAAGEQPPIGPIRIEFADGLIGLPERRAFLLSRAAAPGTFWMESTEHERLAFLLVDPFPFFDGYSVELDSAQLRDVLADDPSDIAVLAIVTLPPEPDGVCTANLQAPLAINLRTGRARQLVLTRTDYGTRCPLAWDLAA